MVTADPLADVLREADGPRWGYGPDDYLHLARAARDFIAAEIDALTPVGEFGYREGYLDALGIAVRTAKGGSDG